MKNLKILFSIGLLTGVVGCSNAAEGVGNIDADIGGESYAGATLGKTSEHEASATVRNFGPITMLNMQAHDLEAESMMKNVFNIEVSLSNAGSSPQVMSATVSYWPQGMSEKFYTSEESTVSVSFEQFEMGDNAHVVGTFSGRMCAKADFYSAINRADCKDVNGTFDTPLLNE